MDTRCVTFGGMEDGREWVIEGWVGHQISPSLDLKEPCSPTGQRQDKIHPSKILPSDHGMHPESHG